MDLTYENEFIATSEQFESVRNVPPIATFATKYTVLRPLAEEFRQKTFPEAM
jgi:hypothetical protein